MSGAQLIPHTPGPWRVVAQGDASHYALITESGRWVIAFLQNGELMEARQLANARLIAHAPDLLQTLKFCEAAMNEGGRPRLLQAWRQARAVIARATGAQASDAAITSYYTGRASGHHANRAR